MYRKKLKLNFGDITQKQPTAVVPSSAHNSRRDKYDVLA